MSIFSLLHRLWNGGVHGDQHKLTMVEPAGLAEWFTVARGVRPLWDGQGRGEMDAAPIWLGWPNASWNTLEGPWSRWSSAQLSGCIIRHLRGDHRPEQYLACPLCKGVEARG